MKKITWTLLLVGGSLFIYPLSSQAGFSINFGYGSGCAPYGYRPYYPAYSGYGPAVYSFAQPCVVYRPYRRYHRSYQYHRSPHAYTSRVQHSHRYRQNYYSSKAR